MRHVHITKADGTAEFFKVEKLRRSLRRAGASPTEINEIVSKILQELYDGIQTQEIYRRAFALLHEQEPPIAARYSLRRALFLLGPTGFPFESFLGRLFQTDGYQVRNGLIIPGKCADHEIDIAAFKSDHSFVGEAKFHARPGVKTDLQVALYSYARLLDLREQKICHDSVCGIKEFWLVTNTKFTSAAERYAECTGLKLLSWDYPLQNNLHDRIQRAKIYPITVIQSLSINQLATLIDNDIIICRDLINNPTVLRRLHLSTKKQERILREAEMVISSGH